MAVYKPTYCYPHLGPVDIRTANRDANIQPVEYVGCKVDTSNTEVTGYSIKLYDDDGSVVFPVGDPIISPISELAAVPLTREEKILNVNTGYNGTMLKIPLFQSEAYPLLRSYNAVYYKARYSVDHIIMDTAVKEALGFDSVPLASFANIDNWERDAYGHLSYDWGGAPAGTKIVLDGEYLSAGDVILVAGFVEPTVIPQDPDDGNWKKNAKIGVYRVVERDPSDEESDLILAPESFSGEFFPIDPTTGEPATSVNILIAKGETFHNVVISYYAPSVSETVPETHRSAYFRANTGSMWRDLNGQEISGLTEFVNAPRWEITLYQGDGTVTESGNEIRYDEISTKWMDIIEGSGTILGSTADRIQIADKVFDPTNPNAEIHIPSAASGTLVLLNKFISLGVLATLQERTVFTGGPRVSIKNYDASYGHVYPTDNIIITSAMINRSSDCQVYGHSNNPEEILPAEIVEWGFASTEATLLVNEDDPLVQRRILIDPTSDVVRDYPLRDMDRLALAAQAHTEQNGVYTLYTDVTYYFYHNTLISESAYEAMSEQEKTEVVITNYEIRRSPGYTEWASYIGKYIFCQNGDCAQQNLQSLATAGLYTLWDPRSEVSGSSSLILVLEKPMLLFPDMIREQGTFDLYLEDVSTPEPTDPLKIVLNDKYVDGVYPTAGEIILLNSGLSFLITKVEWGHEEEGDEDQLTLTLSASGYDEVSAGQCIYFTNGHQYGGQTFIWPEGRGLVAWRDITWAPYTAKVLKNTPTCTYISPYVSLKSNTYLKLGGAHFVVFDGETQGTPWVKILSHNDTVYAIGHKKLSCTGWDGMNKYYEPITGTVMWGFNSEKSDAGTPWKYELRSHFTASNENPFYAYQTPYLILTKDGSDYLGLSMEQGLPVTVEATLTSHGGDLYTVDDSLVVATYTYYIDQSLVSGDTTTIGATYIQFDQISWESYRWLLIDDAGRIVQDTGDKYSGLIENTFYGLTNNSNAVKMYYVVLFVSDERGYLLKYVIQLKVAPTKAQPLPIPFLATTDCDTHSVLLEYQNVLDVYPGFVNDNEYQVYDARNDTEDSPWDGGIVYTGDQMAITGEAAASGREVDYIAGSTIDGHDSGAFSLGKGVEYGVSYAGGTVSNDYESDIDDITPLTLSSDSGEFYFTTEVLLDDNYCGNILTLALEAHPDTTSELPVPHIDGTVTDEAGYLLMSMEIPDNLNDTGTELRDNRDNINFTLSTGTGARGPFVTINGLMFYLQDSSFTYYSVRLNEGPFVTSDDEEFCLDDSESVSYNVSLGDGVDGSITSAFGDDANPADPLYHWFTRTDATDPFDADSVFYYLQREELADAARSYKTQENYSSEFLELPSTSADDMVTPFIYYAEGAYWGYFNKALGNCNLVAEEDVPEGCLDIEQGRNASDISRGAPSFWVEDRHYIVVKEDTSNMFYKLTGETLSYNAWGAELDTQHAEEETLIWPLDDTHSYWNETSDGILSSLPGKWENMGLIEPRNYAQRMTPIERHPGTLSTRKYRIEIICTDASGMYDKIKERVSQISVARSYESSTHTYTLDFDHGTLVARLREIVTE